jgi:hypothetical protein
MNSPLYLFKINPEELERYYIFRGYQIVDYGDKEYIINYFEHMDEDWRNKHMIYDSLHITYSFADIVIEIYDDDYDESKFTYDDFLICRS